jgi:hypothetical protein
MSSPTSSSNSYATLDVTGNWQFGPIDAFMGPYPLISFTGALAGQGEDITATFHGSGTCVSPTQDITFTGSEDASGNLVLTSTNLPNNAATLSGVINTAGVAPYAGAALAVTGSGPCITSAPMLVGSEFPPATGTYAGTLQTNSGPTATFTANLTQTPANLDGQFPLSGAITVAGATCSNTFPISIVFSGAQFAASLTSTSGPAATADLTVQLTPGKPPTTGSVQTDLSWSITILGNGCNAGYFNGDLHKQ